MKNVEAFPDTKFVVLSGDIAEEILNYLKSEEFDLIIMDTHDRKGMEKVLFGSVAEHVAKISVAPVFLLNHYKIP